MGIDVGVRIPRQLLDNDTHEIIRQGVMTTHDHPMGVAAGVIECFETVSKNNIPPDMWCSLPTAQQATNALLGEMW